MVRVRIKLDQDLSRIKRAEKSLREAGFVRELRARNGAHCYVWSKPA